MKQYRTPGLLVLLISAALALAGCGGSSTAQQEKSQEEVGSGAKEMVMGSGDEAPAMLIQDGEYSDERFIDMIAAHHQMAIEMAQAEQENGEITELQQIADNVVSSQQSEIEELRSIKEEQFGTSELPTMMNMEDPMMSAMTMPGELAQQESVDQEFIDSMLPHHSGAIELASIARMQSDNPDIQRIARNIIDEQSREIGEMIQIRQQNFPRAS